jgi:hypothetical protein
METLQMTHKGSRNIIRSQRVRDPPHRGLLGRTRRDGTQAARQDTRLLELAIGDVREGAGGLAGPLTGGYTRAPDHHRAGGGRFWDV